MLTGNKPHIAIYLFYRFGILDSILKVTTEIKRKITINFVRISKRSYII